MDDRQHDGNLQGGIVEDAAEPDDSEHGSQTAEDGCEHRLHAEDRDLLSCEQKRSPALHAENPLPAKSEAIRVGRRAQNDDRFERER